MSKKQNSIRRIENVHFEIDYDKLAEAISKASAESEKKTSEHSRVRFKAMKMLNGIVYSGIYSLCIVCLYPIWKSYSFTEPIDLIARILLSIVLIIVGVVMFLSQQESFDESYEESKDHFNTNLSFIALILALIALLKEYNH